ncbi:hypothetical protein E2C01_086882 [Portunus trituberculatus]|uniref:Uncharacterized protein n=1 Tax=Portunus trituberculatus TaxID=210409 RepID=A0A5B7J6J2_PORTR|nr:hypothetical protein [Portunus trituberculatus]
MMMSSENNNSWSWLDLGSNPEARRFEINTTLEEIKMTTKTTSTCVKTKVSLETSDNVHT